MTTVTACPPPLPATESQQPLVSPKPKWVGLLVKSLSSQVTKMTELPVHAGEDMIFPTHSDRNASPVLMRPWTCGKLHGSLAGVGLNRPCMSWHWSGLI